MSGHKRKFEVNDNPTDADSDADIDTDSNPRAIKKPKLKKGSPTKKPPTVGEDPEPSEPQGHAGAGAQLIYSRDNHVYFYTDINTNTMLSLQKEVQTVVDNIVNKAKVIQDMKFTVKHPPLILHINSPGGGIFAAFTFIDFMAHIKRKYPTIKFHSVVEGRAASAATLISVTADKRFITEYGYMLIHQLWSMSFGKYNEIKDDVSNLDRLMERIKRIYLKHSKVPEDQLDEILKHDIYWDAETCKKYKLVDQIL